MTRDYVAIIAALRAKAKATEFDAERDALNAKADELVKEHHITEDKPGPLYIDDWVQQNYRMSRDDFIRDFFGAPIFQEPKQFHIIILGEDQKWRRSYLWPPDGSPLPNPDHSWEDTELWAHAMNAGRVGVI